MPSKRRFQLSLRTALLAILLLAVALSAWVNSRPTVHFSHSRYQSRPALTVPRGFDVKELDAVVSSPQFANELMQENPEHQHLIQARWNEILSGIELQHVGPRSFQMVVTYPAYEVRQGHVSWQADDSAIQNSKVGIAVSSKNDDFKATVLRKVYEKVHELSQGKFEVTAPKDHGQYLPPPVARK